MMATKARVKRTFEMTDDEFLRHLDKRHSKNVEGKDLAGYPYRSAGWIKPYRAFHRYLHKHVLANHVHVRSK